MTTKEKKENPFSGLQLWKVVGIFALVFTAVQLATSVFRYGIEYMMEQFNAGENLQVFLGSTIAHIGMVAITLLITVPVIKSVFSKPGLEGIYPREKKKWVDLFIGMAIAAAAVLVVFIIEVVLGTITISGLRLSGSSADIWLRTIWLSLLMSAVSAIGEEVLFRGLLLKGIELTWDKWGALFISAIIFGGSHILTSGATASNWLEYIPMLALPGVMLGWAYLKTGNLWLATGIHFIWILLRDDLLNLSGNNQGNTLFGLTTDISGPKWFTGTSFGIETGAAGILVVLLAILGVWLWTKNIGNLDPKK